MRDDHAYVMQVKLCKANTRGVTDGAACVAVVVETLMNRNRGVLPAVWRCLVNRRVLGGMHRGHALAGVKLASPRQRAFHLLRRRTLEQRANFSAGPAILGHRCLWKAMKQGRRSGDVLACLSEVREGPIISEDPLVYITGRGACAPTASTVFDLVIDLCILPHEPLYGLIDLQLLGSQLLHPYTR